LSQDFFFGIGKVLLKKKLQEKKEVARKKRLQEKKGLQEIFPYAKIKYSCGKKKLFNHYQEDIFLALVGGHSLAPKTTSANAASASP